MTARTTVDEGNRNVAATYFGGVARELLDQPLTLTQHLEFSAAEE